MRNRFSLAALATVAALMMSTSVMPAWAETEVKANAETGTPASPAEEAVHKGLCLTTYQIDRTKILDDSTIIFFMKDGKAWKNTLPFRCSGLKFANGFSYSPTNDRICANLQTIRLIDRGTACGLGEFSPYTPPTPKSQSKPESKSE